MAATKKTKSTAKKSTAKKSSAKGASKKSTRRRPSAKASSSRATRKQSAARPDKSVEAYRDALERSVTLSRDWIQELFDDAVKRGRMTRKDANELVSSLMARGRKGSQDLAKDLERVVKDARSGVEGRTKAARKGVDTRTRTARKRAETAAGKATKSARDAADEPLAQADRLRRRAKVGSTFPITAYDELTAAQVRARLKDLKKPELRKVRTYEKNNKARKSVLGDIETKLN